MQATIGRDLLRAGVLASYGSQKEAARECGMTESMMSRIFAGVREIAPDIKEAFSAKSVKAGIAIILEASGYKAMFNSQMRDSHPQTLLRKIEIEDTHADNARRRIAERLVDKFGDEDLSGEDIIDTRGDIKELLDEAGMIFRLIAELDGQYPSLKITELLQEKEKAVCKRLGQ